MQNNAPFPMDISLSVRSANTSADEIGFDWDEDDTVSNPPCQKAVLLNSNGNRPKILKIGFISTCIVALMLIIGAGLEIGQTALVRSDLQKAVDAAALAGARSIEVDETKGKNDALATAARNNANGRAVSNKSDQTKVSVQTIRSVEGVPVLSVTATMRANHFLLGIFGHPDDVAVTAYAGPSGTVNKVDKGKVFPLAVSIEGLTSKLTKGQGTNQIFRSQTVNLRLDGKGGKTASFISFSKDNKKADSLQKLLAEAINEKPTAAKIIPVVNVGDVLHLYRGSVGQTQLANPRLIRALTGKVILMPVISAQRKSEAQVIGFISGKIENVHCKRRYVDCITLRIIKTADGASVGTLTSTGNEANAMREISAGTITLLTPPVKQNAQIASIPTPKPSATKSVTNKNLRAALAVASPAHSKGHSLSETPKKGSKEARVNQIYISKSIPASCEKVMPPTRNNADLSKSLPKGAELSGAVPADKSLALGETKIVKTKKATAESKQATAGTRKAITETKIVIPETKKATADTKIIIPETKKATTDTKIVIPETKKATADTKIIIPETKKATADTKTVSSETQKATAEAKKASAETKKPSTEDRTQDAETTLADAAVVDSKTSTPKAVPDHNTLDQINDSVDPESISAKPIKVSFSESLLVLAGLLLTLAAICIVRRYKHEKNDEAPLRRTIKQHKEEADTDDGGKEKRIAAVTQVAPAELRFARGRAMQHWGFGKDAKPNNEQMNRR